jgi:hypothetical protein
MRDHCIRNGSWTLGVDIPKPLEPWTYEGAEQVLIEMSEKQDREKSREQNNA